MNEPTLEDMVSHHKETQKQVLDKLLSLKIKSEFELNVARQANNYQRAGFKKAQIRHKIYRDLYDFVKGLYSNFDY